MRRRAPRSSGSSASPAATPDSRAVSPVSSSPGGTRSISAASTSPTSSPSTRPSPMTWRRSRLCRRPTCGGVPRGLPDRDRGRHPAVAAGRVGEGNRSGVTPASGLSPTVRLLAADPRLSRIRRLPSISTIAAWLSHNRFREPPWRSGCGALRAGTPADLSACTLSWPTGKAGPRRRVMSAFPYRFRSLGAGPLPVIPSGFAAVVNRRPAASRPRSAPRGGRTRQARQSGPASRARAESPACPQARFARLAVSGP